MRHLYLYQNGVRGDVVLSRALYRAVLETGRFEVTIGVCRDDEQLVTDLGRDGCRIVTSEFANTPHGSPLDLVSLRPADATAISAWLGGRGERPTRQWPDVVESFHRNLRRRGIDDEVADPEGEVPMPGLVAAADVLELRRPSIYLDTARTDLDLCYFVHDLRRLARVLPDWDLLCTAPVDDIAANVIDVSHLGWAQRAALSERCVALVGTTPDPFALTLTEANRWKPKALCGYDARVCQPFWDYPGNPLELLGTMDELVDFLLANVVEVSRQ